MNQKVATSIAALGVGCIAAQSLGVFGGASPSIMSPAALPLVLPALFGTPALIIVAAFVGLFWLWGASPSGGEPVVPRRTTKLLVVVSMLSVLNFGLGWSFGIRYQGATYIIVCIVTSVLMLGACIVMLLRTRERPSFGGTLLVHTMAFAWIASYAFPYLGETP